MYWGGLHRTVMINDIKKMKKRGKLRHVLIRDDLRRVGWKQNDGEKRDG